MSSVSLSIPLASTTAVGIQLVCVPRGGCSVTLNDEVTRLAVGALRLPQNRRVSSETGRRSMQRTADAAAIQRRGGSVHVVAVRRHCSPGLQRSSVRMSCALQTLGVQSNCTL